MSAPRGPKPQPNELKILKGSRPDRINADAPPAILERPACPGFLKGEALDAWDELVPLLEELGVLSKTDGFALGVLCTVFARWQSATTELAAGLTSETAAGGEKSHPAAKVAAAAEAQLMKLLAEFGLTPSSRGRLRLGKTEVKKGGLKDFVKRKPG